MAARRVCVWCARVCVVWVVGPGVWGGVRAGEVQSGVGRRGKWHRVLALIMVVRMLSELPRGKRALAMANLEPSAKGMFIEGMEI